MRSSLAAIVSLYTVYAQLRPQWLLHILSQVAYLLIPLPGRNVCFCFGLCESQSPGLPDMKCARLILRTCSCGVLNLATRVSFQSVFAQTF